MTWSVFERLRRRRLRRRFRTCIAAMMGIRTAFVLAITTTDAPLLRRFACDKTRVRDNQALLDYFGNASVGDFDGNGVHDVNDIDALMAQIRSDAWREPFDLDLNQHVDVQDAVVWVEQVARSYFGDANLDGQFSISDLVQVLALGQYEDSLPANSDWLSDDSHGDQEFDTKDLVVAFQSGGYEQGPRAAVQLVPEPQGVVIRMVAAALMIGALRGRRVRHD